MGKEGDRKEACWALSNITAGTAVQIQSVLDGATLPVVYELITREDCKDGFRKEASYAVSNAISGGSEAQRCTLLEQGSAEALCTLLSTDKADILQNSLVSLVQLMETTKLHSEVLDRVLAHGSLERLEELEAHEYRAVSAPAAKLVAGCVKAQQMKAERVRAEQAAQEEREARSDQESELMRRTMSSEQRVVRSGCGGGLTRSVSMPTAVMSS